MPILPNVLCPVFTMAINEWPVNERDKAYSEAGPHSIQGLYRLGNAAAILRIERSTGGLDDSVAVADDDVDAVAKTSPQCDELARLKKRKADALGSFFERLDEMECELAASPAPQQQTGIKSYIVVVEGLDGSGKSSLVEQLSQRLHEKYSHAGAKVVAWATPTASLSAVRPVFDKRGGPVARAFYMVSNYMLQYELQQLEKRQQLLLSQEDIGPDSKTSTNRRHVDRLLVVVIDRWYTSTVAYSVSWKNTEGGMESVDALESSIFRWPGDLRPPDILCLLRVDDDVRRERVQSRARANSSSSIGGPKIVDYNPWDERLDKDENLGRRIMRSFERVAEGLLASNGITRVARLDASRSKENVIQDALSFVEGIIPFN